MKKCLACGMCFSDKGWQCPECEWKPELIDGFPAFAPELAAQNDVYAPEMYNEIAQTEANNFWFTGRNKLLQFILNHYFPTARSFLEIGCGTGFVLRGFAKMRKEMCLSGAEINIAGIRLAQARVPRAEFIQMDAYHMPFEEEFDVVGAFDVLEHIDEDGRALQEIFRSVRPGGGMILTVPQHQWLWSVTDEIACHRRRYSRRDLKTKVEAAGFRVCRISSFVTFLLPLMFLSRIRFRMTPKSRNQKEVIKELNLSPILNAVFDKVCDWERTVLQSGVSLPAGGSLICVGTKEQ